MIHRINPLRIAILLMAFFMGSGDNVFAQCKDWVRLGGITAEVTISYPQPIAVDGSGTPYILNEESTTNKATVRKYNGTDWTVVGTTGFSPGSILKEKIKIDNSGTPYVAFLDGNAGWKATVMKYNGASWVTVGAAGFSNVALDLAFAIDASGTPYVGYVDYTDSSKVSVMKFNGSSWTLVGGASFSTANASGVSMAIDNTGKPYVGFADGAHSGGLTVMKYSGSSWAIVGAANISGANVSRSGIAISSAGVPYVGYGSNDGSYGLFVKAFDGVGWNAVGGEIFTGVADNCTVAVDASGTPYVGCLSDHYSYRPAVLKFNGSSWDLIGSIDLRYMAYVPSFAFTGDGTAYMSYGNDLFTDEGIVTRYETVSTTISGTPTICTGATTALTHPQGGGIWSSSGNNIATVGSETGIVSGVAGGVVNLSYTIGSCSATKTMTVNPNTGTITGAHSVNAGSSVTLSNIAVGGAWSVSNANASISSAGVLTGITAGSTTVSYAVTGSCGTASATLIVDVLSASGLACHDWVDAASSVASAPAGGFFYNYKLKIAPDGTTYALYTTVAGSYANNTVNVVRFNGSEWEPVGGGTLPYNPESVGAAADMTVDNAGTIYVVAEGWGDGHSYVYRYNGYYWEVLPVIPSTSAEEFSLATDASGTLYVAYNDFSDHKVNVIKYNGTNWDVVGAPSFSAGTSYENVDLRISGTTPYVMYLNEDNDYRADVMKFNGASWEYVGAPGVTPMSSYFTSLAVSSDGTPYVVYSGAYYSSMLKFNGTSWEGTGAFGYYDAPQSFSIDGNVPYVGVVNTNTGKGSVLRYSGGAWRNYGSRDFTSEYTSMSGTVVNNGQGYILYAPDATTLKGMKYAIKASALAPISGPAAVCTGSAITLSESVTVGSWSSGDASVVTVGSGTGIVNGVSGGTAAISYSIGSDCIETYTVSNASTAGIITGPINVQVGHTAAFSDAITGGTWSVSNSNASISATGVLTGLSAGTVIVSYATGSCGSHVATAVVNVYTTAGSCSAWETVGTTGYSDWQVYHISSAVDAGGRPYVVYNDLTSGDRPLVKRYDGSSWVQVGPGALDAAGGTQENAIALDNTGMPYVAYIDNTVGGVRVKKFNGESWSDVGFIDNTSSVVDMAFDASGKLYVVLNDVDFAFHPIVLRYNGSAWETVGRVPGTLADYSVKVKLAIHGTTPYVVASDGEHSSNVTVWKFDGAEWQVVGSAGFIGGTSGAKDPHIAINSTGTPYVICADNSNGAKATVKKFDGSSWVAVGGPLSIDTAQDLSIVIDNDDNVLVTYFQDGTTPIMAVKKYDGTSWSNVGPSSVTEVGRWTSLAVDLTGVPYMTFADIAHAEGRIATIRYFASSSGSISGSTTVCNGSTSTLSSSSTGGTWSSSDAAIASVGSSNGVVTGVANGTAVISYTVGSCSASIIVTVNASGGSAGAITGTLSVCTGVTTTLANATTGGAWTSSNASVATVGSATGIVSGVATGSAAITYTVTGACGSATATKVVTVNPVISAGTISGVSTLCAGATASFSNTATGGTWSSDNVTVATVGSASGIVTGVGSGNATITYAVSGACGSSTATKVVTVGTSASISGSLMLCAGMTSTLSAGASGGTWSSSNTAVATVGATTGILTAVGTGTTNITYSLGTGCTATAVAGVSAPALISGTATACVGQTSVLTDATAGGTWSSSNTSLATVDASTGVVTGVAAGTATISYVVSTGCYRTSSFIVKALPPAVATPVTVCIGSTLNIPPPSSNGLSWASSNTSVATMGSSSGVLTGLSAGTTTLTYTTNTGCFVTTVATVNMAPAITGVTSLCTGSVSTISSAITGGVWSSGSTSVASVNSTTGVVTGSGAGTAAITYTTSGCRSTTVVSVSALAAITGSPSLCLGASAVLGNTTPGGTWSSSNSSIASVDASGVVTGVTGGTATITYTITSGCTRTIIATVSAASGAISGTLSVCPGSTTTLSAATTGGTWSGGNTAIATINSSTGVVTGVGAGTINVSYTLTGCRSTAITTVNPLPAVIAGTLNACVAQTATLSDATTGGAWSSNNTAIATIDPSTGEATGVAAGATTMTYTLPTGCSRTGTFTVKALPPAIVTPIGACIGTSTTIAPPSTNGKSWSSSNTAVGTIGSASGILTGVSTGTTVLTYTTTTGCFVTTEATVYPTPAAGTITGPSTLVLGNTITLNDAAGGGVWSSSNTARATIGSADGIVTGVGGGTATISYSVSNPGCTVRATMVVHVTFSRPEGNGVTVSNFQLYPNPTTGVFTVEADESGTFSVFTMDGRAISRQNINTGINQLTLSNELASGIYMCRFTSESGNTTMVRLVYER